MNVTFHSREKLLNRRGLRGCIMKFATYICSTTISFNFMKRCMEIACHNATFFLTCFWVTYFSNKGHTLSRYQNQLKHLPIHNWIYQHYYQIRGKLSAMEIIILQLPLQPQSIFYGNILQPHVSTLLFYNSSCTISPTTTQYHDKQYHTHKGERSYLTHI